MNSPDGSVGKDSNSKAQNLRDALTKVKLDYIKKSEKETPMGKLRNSIKDSRRCIMNRRRTENQKMSQNDDIFSKKSRAFDGYTSIG